MYRNLRRSTRISSSCQQPYPALGPGDTPGLYNRVKPRGSSTHRKPRISSCSSGIANSRESLARACTTLSDGFPICTCALLVRGTRSSRCNFYRIASCQRGRSCVPNLHSCVLFFSSCKDEYFPLLYIHSTIVL